jgi:hypothetical protein
MVPLDRGKYLDREGVRVRPQSSLARHFRDAMSGKKKTAQRPESSKATINVALYPASVVSMAAHNLINMAAVSAVSGTVLLGLLLVHRF